jgi:hypothetical protein
VLEKERNVKGEDVDVEMTKKANSFDPQALPVSRLPTIMGKNI